VQQEVSLLKPLPLALHTGSRHGLDPSENGHIGGAAVDDTDTEDDDDDADDDDFIVDEPEGEVVLANVPVPLVELTTAPVVVGSAAVVGAQTLNNASVTPSEQYWFPLADKQYSA
jgi:hypothetical protein